jgi:hypothetical protein
MPAGATYEPLATNTLGSATSSITFTGISQSYTDLVCVFDGSVSVTANLYIRVGDGSLDSGSNYSGTVISAKNDGVMYGASSVYANSTGAQIDYWATGANKRRSIVVNIQNYSNTNTYKSFLSRASEPDTELSLICNPWRSTSAINQVQIYPASGNLEAGSTFTIYGIAAA